MRGRRDTTRINVRAEAIVRVGGRVIFSDLGAESFLTLRAGKSACCLCPIWGGGGGEGRNEIPEKDKHEAAGIEGQIPSSHSPITTTLYPPEGNLLLNCMKQGDGRGGTKLLKREYKFVVIIPHCRSLSASAATYDNASTRQHY